MIIDGCFMDNVIIVSVVMPVYNEAKYIDNCIQSLLLQDYPLTLMEWIFVDGLSTDDTVKRIAQYQKDFPELIKIEKNPKKIVPCAMNIGIAISRGKYIIRLDAHADYNNDYISKCVYHLDNSDADNVGGVATTKAKGFAGNCIAKVLSCKFGVGNSSFRTNGNSGYVDTVPFGAFRREVFSKYGGYDERLIRNQDNEMNYRIRKSGGKIFLSDDIHLTYYCRDSIRSIIEMAITNGKWNIISYRLCPGSMSIRHFIPLLFVITIIFFILLGLLYKPFLLLFYIEASVYLLLDFFFSFKCCSSLGEFFLLLILFPLFHFSYGLGSISGILLLFSMDFIKKKKYVAPKI